MAYVARHRHAPMSAQKARLIATLVRGKNVGEALNVLRYQPQRAARFLEKVIQSAQANAEVQGVKDVEALVIAKVFVNEGVRLKRWQPGPRGHVMPIIKRRCHICVELDQVKEE